MSLRFVVDGEGVLSRRRMWSYLEQEFLENVALNRVWTESWIELKFVDCRRIEFSTIVDRPVIARIPMFRIASMRFHYEGPMKGAHAEPA